MRAHPTTNLLHGHQEKVLMLPSAPEFWECQECWEHIGHFWSLLKLQLAPGDTWSSSLPRTNIGIHECCIGHAVTTQIFLRHTADIRLDSGCPTPCNGCGVLHYRTPRAQLGRVFRCFPFCYNSNISLIYCGCPVGLRTSDSVQ